MDIYKGFTGVTGGDGCVTFEEVPYGTYNVEELLQSGWENVSGLGSVTVSGNSFTNDGINRFVVTNKQIGGDGPVDNNAQLSIGGMKFHNSEKRTNPRGDYHAGFHKLPNWTFNLYKEDSSGNWGSAIKTTTTDVDGNFNFKVNGAGTYHVCEVMQTGWSQVRQDRSGTPYHIVTENASPNRENEGPYCSTTVFDGSKNHSTKKYFGNYQEESGEQEPQMCMIVSDDEFNSVDNHLAVEVTSPSGNWFSSSLLNPAKWIWSSSAVETPTTSDVEKTFTRKFTVTNPSASANLEIASDNGYKVVLNGTLITDRLAEELTYSGITTHDVSGKLVNGTNTLVITVRNHGLEGSTPDSNPAGLLYRLEVSGEVCGDIEFVPESSTNGGGNTSGGGTTISSYGQGGGGGPLVEEVAGASDSFGEVAGDSDSFPGLPNTGFAGVGYERAMAQNGLATTVSLAILAGALYFVRRKSVATVESR